MENYLWESQDRNFQKWHIMGVAVYPQPSPPPQDYPSEVGLLKWWVDERIHWLDQYIPGVCNPNAVQVGNNYASVNVYPNPMEQTTTFSLFLSEEAEVSLSLADVTGREAARYLYGKIPAGESKIVFNREKLPAGIYFYQLQTNSSAVMTGKLIVQ
jgi:hypothetical protein